MFATCVPKVWPRVSAVWTLLPSLSLSNRPRVLSVFSRDDSTIPLPRSGRGGPTRAGHHARARGWLRDQGDYCRAGGLPLSGETGGVVALMLAPQRADCPAGLGARAGRAAPRPPGRPGVARQAQPRPALAAARDQGAGRVGAALSPARQRDPQARRVAERDGRAAAEP